ncbi:pyridoxal-dependent decarboxylase [Reichenbachiella carrageenanivorans]|uniref:Pyridoxal-dependent decarboxylase n=1 Tax=Reichenbachiella carrageenanivorans TaxID=2979869 RepID=A0ABY6CYS8_9BACT|nr:pyridoxal-dependent decarboxylase [Reichenbachiella carrageenanivorans]UXX79057.1 pyridoxal-dependent decarboxylase [Reichenbachiella carrageenanivorans]
MFWEKYSRQKIRDIVFESIDRNLNYRVSPPIGLPASYLDPKVFYSDAPFLSEAPFMSTMLANPNHIGCHTMGDSEPVFKGTQALEQELIALCATEIFGAASDAVDGYVASGGTEANIQAFWVMRNYFVEAHEARHEEIAMVYSSDAHYSMPKGVNLLNIKSIVASVDDETRLIVLDDLKTDLIKAKAVGVKHFILVMNMSTTMFGSVDDMAGAVDLFQSLDLNFKIHVDGAYGGFIYPFSAEDPLYSFQNQHVFSFSLDAHKMLLSPYGTGVVLIRKGYISYAMTKEANYVKGKDYTLIGSRSGANAVAIWMIMRAYGSDGWKAKIANLLERTDWLCEQLTKRGISFYRHPKMNIVTLRPDKVDPLLAEKYFLVPDDHDDPMWWKIVVMDHVTEGILDQFLLDLDKTLTNE